MLDPREELPLAQSGEPREAGDLLHARRARVEDAVRVAGAEGPGVGVDHDAAGRAGEEPAAVVDDRAACADQVDGAIRLLVRLGGVLLPVQHLQRPRRRSEERQSGATTSGETADRGRRSPGCGSTARLRESTARSGNESGSAGGSGNGSERPPDRRVPGYSSAISSARSASANERHASSGSARSASTAPATAGRSGRWGGRRALRERGVPLGRVELVGEAFRRHRVEVELAVRVAAGGEDEHRAAPGGIELRLGNRDVVLHEPAQHHEELARARVEARLLELLEPSPGLGSHPSRLHSSPSLKRQVGHCYVAVSPLHPRAAAWAGLSRCSTRLRLQGRRRVWRCPRPALRA